MDPFYGWGSTASRLEPFKEAVYFIALSSQKFLILILLTVEDERLSRLWSQPMVLNMRLLD